MLNKLMRLTALALVNSPLRGTRFFRSKAALLRTVGFAVDPTAKIVGPLRMSPTCTLTIEGDTWIGTSMTIHGNGTVHIGANCDVAPDVTFLTGSHDIGTSVRRAGPGLSTTIRVGYGCWIGARSTLIGPLLVGPSAVVGAASLITHDVPPNALVAGVPARKLRDL